MIATLMNRARAWKRLHDPLVSKVLLCLFFLDLSACLTLFAQAAVDGSVALYGLGVAALVGCFGLLGGALLR